MGVHDGGCLCGKLRYRTTGEPSRVIYCHCTFCQRLTGSSHNVEAIFDEPQFALNGARPARFTLRSEGSGKMIDVHFCETCGTRIGLSFERFPGTFAVLSGTFDDPSWVARFPERTWRIFLDEAMAGTVIPAGVRVWPRHRLAPDGSPNEATIHDAPFVVG